MVPIKIVFFDCDGTLTRVKSSWEYLHRRLSLWDNHADRYQNLFKEGRIDYHEFCKKDALLWRGLSVSRVMETIQEIPYQDGAGEAIDTIKDLGIFTVIISTGLSFLVEKVKNDLGIHTALSNELLVENGRLTGGTKINVEYNNKGCIVEGMLKSMEIKRGEACAVGDGDGDRGMFEAVGLPIGFNPHPEILSLLDHAIHGNSLLPLVDIIKNHG
jgi:phosphoserine phosphatase